MQITAFPTGVPSSRRKKLAAVFGLSCSLVLVVAALQDCRRLSVSISVADSIAPVSAAELQVRCDGTVIPMARSENNGTRIFRVPRRWQAVDVSLVTGSIRVSGRCLRRAGYLMHLGIERIQGQISVRCWYLESSGEPTLSKIVDAIPIDR